MILSITNLKAGARMRRDRSRRVEKKAACADERQRLSEESTTVMRRSARAEPDTVSRFPRPGSFLVLIANPEDCLLREPILRPLPAGDRVLVESHRREQRDVPVEEP